MTQPKTGIYSLISLDILDEFSQSFHHINAPYVQMMDLYFITMCILCTFASFLLLARGRHCGAKPAIRYALPRISSLARSANLPEGLSILLALISSFFTMSKAISVSTGSIFTIFLPNGRYLRFFFDLVHFFPIPQGTLPWQPILCRKQNANLSLIHIWRCRRSYACRSRWSPYH